MDDRVLIIILLALIVIAIVVLIVYLLKPKRNDKNKFWRNEVYINDGVEITSGALKVEKNEHIDLGILNDTICIDNGKLLDNNENLKYAHQLCLRSAASVYSASFNDKVVIGRVRENDGQPAIIIPDVRVSGKHCVVVASKGKFYIKDLGSSNHTYVNGKQITDYAPIADGDTLRIGSDKYTVSIIA